MADRRVSALTSQTGAGLASGDLFETVDVSDTSMAATGTNKKVTATELATGLADLQYNAAYVAGFFPEAYGAHGDGTTDDTAAINAAISAAASAGGGVVWLSAKTYRCNGALTVPFNSTTPFTQKPVRITGNGGSGASGVWTRPTANGPVLDLRYDGTDTLHPAKIDTRGSGRLEVDHVTLLSGGTDNFPFIHTTNTTIFIHDNAFLGNNANSGTTCQQDAVILGGVDGDPASNLASGPFQGYGTVIARNYYDRIRAGVTWQSAANGVIVEDEVYSLTCGSNLASGAPYYFNSPVGTPASGNVIRGGTIEMTHYPYLVSFQGNESTNLVLGSGGFDPSGTTVGMAYFGGASANNSIMPGYWADDVTYPIMNGARKTYSSCWSALPTTPAYFATHVRTAQIDGLTKFGSTSADLPDGTNSTWDTGPGGSYANVRAYALRKLNYATQAVEGGFLDGGKLSVGNAASATTPGSVVKKIEVFDAAGASLGFVPVYSAIT